jgi:hypothetical protein
MRSFLKRLLFAAVVLGLFSVFLISVGTWPTIVQAVSVAFGQDTAEKVDQFGQTSKDLTDQAADTYEEMRNGTWEGVDYQGVNELLRELGTVAPGQRTPDYNRALFGEPWADVDGNHCDTRNDILSRDLTTITKQGACTVLTGVLADPYTGSTISFTRGPKTSSAVQIDHIRALSDAWVAGAYAWTNEQRVAFANDPMNLRAVDGPTNNNKSDKGPADWSPPDAAYACQYVAQYVAISAKYDLPITSDDRDAIDRTLATCQ